MKKSLGPHLGVIGGLSYHSTLIYYRLLNEGFAKQQGADRSFPLFLYSHDFGIIGQAQQSGAWDEVKAKILESAELIANAGCQGILIASNTIHKYAHQIESACNIPVLHIGDAIRDQLIRTGSQRIGLLGTRPTMEEPFLKRRITSGGKLELFVPDREQRQAIHDLIWNKLVLGCHTAEDKAWFQTFCNNWSSSNSLDAIVLSCTELGLLELKPQGYNVIDSLEAHVEFCLKWYQSHCP